MKSESEPKNGFTLVEAADKLGISYSFMYQLLRTRQQSGLFPNAFKISFANRSRWQIPKDDLDAYITSAATTTLNRADGQRSPDPQPKKVFTLRETAEELGISYSSMVHLIHTRQQSGHFPNAFKISFSENGRWQIPLRDLDAYLTSAANTAQKRIAGQRSPNPQLKKAFTLHEAAEELGISHSTMVRLIQTRQQSGHFPNAFQLTFAQYGRWRIPVGDLLAYVGPTSTNPNRANWERTIQHQAQNRAQPNKFFTQHEAADELGITYNHMYKLLYTRKKSGHFPNAFKKGRWQIPPRDLDAYITSAATTALKRIDRQRSPDPQLKKVFSLREAADELQMSYFNMIRLIRARQQSDHFPNAFKISFANKGHWRIPVADLLDYVGPTSTNPNRANWERTIQHQAQNRPKPNKVFTQREAVHELGISHSYMYKLLYTRQQSGHFPNAYKTSPYGRWRIPVGDLDNFKKIGDNQ